MGKMGAFVLGALGSVAVGIGLEEFIKKYHFDTEGYNSLGFDRYGYDREGYDANGYNKQGFNRAGYDKEGFGYDGYNARGFDKYGYDREGYDADGYNRQRLDRDGMNIFGYDVHGFDRDGFDRKGYDKQGYNVNGFDRAERDREAYRRIVSEIKSLDLDKAYEQMKDGNYRYALSDIRVGIETGIKTILGHLRGSEYEENSLAYNIDVCERGEVFDEDFIDKLRSAKCHCNDPLHINVDKEHRQVHFCYKVLEELIEQIETITDIKVTEEL